MVGNRAARESVVEEAPFVSQPLKLLAHTLDRRKDENPWNMLALPTWHWLFFPPMARSAELSDDGHPNGDVLLGRFSGLRRMWAAGDLEFSGEQARPDRPLTRKTALKSVEARQGRSGPLTFATLCHQIWQDERLLVREQQKLVFKQPEPVGDIRPSRGLDTTAREDWRDEGYADPVLLFRYSALTFNAHRIHYDKDYATNVEGYPQLVMQGPLIATMLADSAVRRNPGRRLKSFRFRFLKPIYAGTCFGLCGRESGGESISLWARDDKGGINAEAVLEFVSDKG